MKIRLKNFKGIKAGPELTWDGLDEIEVDFTGRDGLVAFSGENGGGKSTLIENLHHYPQLVSRGGALWQHVMGRAAEKEFISTFMGHEYRSLIKMDADQGKQEGYLWIDGKSVVNGKITPYKEKVNEIFGQPFTYFRSQFCPQKSKNTQGMQIENMTAGVFRELLQQFLNLQRYAAWEDTAKQAGNILTGQIEQGEKHLLILNNKLAGFEDIKTKLTSAHADLDAHEQAIKQFKIKKAALTDELTNLRDKKSKQEVLIAQKANIEAKIKELEDTLAREQKDSDAELNALRDAYKSLQEQIKGNEELLKLADEINTAAEKESEIQSKIESLAIDHDKLTAETDDNVDSLNKIKTDISTHQAALTQIKYEISSLKNDAEIQKIIGLIDRAQSQTVILEKRDADCQSSTCSFIVAALKAKEELPKLQTEIEQRRTFVNDELGKLSIVMEEEERIISELKEKGLSLESIARKSGDAALGARKELATLRLDLSKVKDLAGKKTVLEVAKAQYDSITKQMEENATKGKELKVKRENRKSDLNGSIKDAQASLAEIKIDTDIPERIGKITDDIRQTDGVLAEKEASINGTRALIMKYESELSARDAVEKDIAAAKEQRESLLGKISRWRYLQIGCGKTGLQNLRIDGAAPRIIYNANKLLAQAYGARYSIRLETQNEDGKEDLQIKIIMENGKEIYLDDISGGQRAWNVQSLWLAMSLLNQEKSGRKYDYFCSDESDGALDVDNAVKYTALYRPFMTEGHLDQLIYISHKPECRSMADHILMFEAGQNPAWE
jgi:exonuclease SbcC